MDEAEQLADWERYFADPNAPASVVHPGARGDHCRNIRQALMRLGFDDSFRFAPPSDLFDDKVSAELKRLQASSGHTSVDGLCGPGTRRLLVATLVGHVRAAGAKVDPFARMTDPEHRATGQLFMSYARKDRTYCEALAALIARWGYAAWFDVGISGGEKFSRTLMERIEQAYLLIVIETPWAMESEWVRREVEHADRSGVRILSVEAAPIAGDHQLTEILQSHHRLGEAPADLTAPSARPYRDQLKQAVRDAHIAQNENRRAD